MVFLIAYKFLKLVQIAKIFEFLNGGFMCNYNVYKDIAERTNGDIYVGVVGTVRTGKSTFITRVM